MLAIREWVTKAIEIRRLLAGILKDHGDTESKGMGVPVLTSAKACFQECLSKPETAEAILRAAP